MWSPIPFIDSKVVCIDSKIMIEKVIPVLLRMIAVFIQMQLSLHACTFFFLGGGEKEWNARDISSPNCHKKYPIGCLSTKNCVYFLNMSEVFEVENVYMQRRLATFAPAMKGSLRINSVEWNLLCSEWMLSVIRIHGDRSKDCAN